MKTIIKICGIIIFICMSYIAWYLISPIFIDVEVIEELPEDFNIIKDNKSPINKSTTKKSINETPQAQDKINSSPSANTSVQNPPATNNNITQTPLLLPNTKSAETIKEKSPPIGIQKKFHGNFERVDYEVKGDFEVLTNGDEKILRINNLDVTNGPDLYLVLSDTKPITGNKDFDTISKLKANKGSFNVDIPLSIDFSRRKYLLIHCKRFSHTFAAAEIESL